MSEKANLIEKNPMITIQFKLTQEEYAEIQRAKVNTGKVQTGNLDYYRELLFKGLELELEKI